MTVPSADGDNDKAAEPVASPDNVTADEIGHEVIRPATEEEQEENEGGEKATPEKQQEKGAIETATKIGNEQEEGCSPPHEAKARRRNT